MKNPKISPHNPNLSSTIETEKAISYYSSPKSVLVSDGHTAYQSTKRLIDKFLATCLLVGGLSGIALSILSVLNAELQATVILFTVFYLVLSAWHIFKGVDLWKGKASGYLWGKIFFAFQIPIITSSFLAYNHFTGILLGLWLEDASVIFKAFFSGGFQFSLVNEAQPIPLSIGINVFAILALVYLIKRQSGIKV